MQSPLKSFHPIKVPSGKGLMPATRRSVFMPSVISAWALLSLASWLHGTDGVWINSSTTGVWGTATNWSGGTVAGGVDAVADFTLDITANRQVQLGANITAGKLIFEDETTPTNSWVLSNGTGGPWSLTLATSTGTPTIQVNNEGVTISAVVAGSQGISKTGAGTLTLSGVNTFTGGVSLAAGTLSVGNAAALNGNLITFTGDAALTWTGTTLDVSPLVKLEDAVTATFGTGAANITFASALQTGPAGTAGLVKNGAGSLTLTAANTYTGLTRARQGRLILAGGDNRLAATGSIALGQNAGNAGILQLGNALGAVNQTTTSITASAAATNAVVGGHSTVSVLTVDTSSAAVSYGGLLGGAGANENNLALAKVGANVLTLTNAGSTFTGGVTLNQGTVSFVAGSLGTGGAVVFTGSSSLQWAAGNTSDISARIKINDGVTATLDTLGNTITLATALQTGVLGTGALTKGGAGTVIITAANTYTGNTRINNGRMILTGGSNRLATVTTLQFGNGANSGVLQLGDASGPSNQTVAGLTVTGGGASQSNAIVGGNAAVSTLTVNNTANFIWEQALGGAGANENNLALVKTGTGTLTLSSGASTFTGDVSITAGSLVISSSKALGSGTKTVAVLSTAVTASLRLNNEAGIALPAGFSFITNNDDVTNAAVVNVAGDNVIGGSISLAVGSTSNNTRLVVGGGSLTLNGNISPQAGPAASLVLILDGANPGVANGLLSDNGARVLGVTKEGAGTWSLNSGGSYSGPTTVAAGRLNLTTANTGGGAVTVADGAALGLTLGGAGQTLVTSAFSAGASGVATLHLGFGAFGNPSNAIITTGTLTTGASTVINVSGTGLSIGQFGLIDYSGSIGGAGFGGFALGSLPARVTASLVNNTAATRVDLNITAFDVPKWTGALSSDWDINSSADPTVGFGTLNWRESVSGTATRYLQFLGVVDSVRFDDSATGSTTVNLTAQISPNSITVANSALNYVFSGAGSLSGTTGILKQGSGSLTLSNVGFNDFTGTTVIEAGSVVLGDGVTPNAGQFGSGPVVNSGELVFNRPEDFAFANVISGGGSVKKLSTGVVLLQGNNATYSGVITVGEGTLLVGNSNALGSTAGQTRVLAGAALDISGYANVAEPVSLVAGGRLKATVGTASKLDGPLALEGGGVVEAGSGTTLTVAGAISGTGGLVKEGAGTVIVTQAATSSGGTIIRGGTLQFGTNNAASTTAAPGAGAIDLASLVGESATLSLLRADNALNLTQVITSSGAGTNAVIVGAGGAASVSGVITLSGVNTFTGNVSILGGALRITNSSALGSGSKTVSIGNASQPGLLLDGSGGGLSISSDIRYTISSAGTGTAVGSTPGAIVNISGDNVLNGRISVVNGGGGNGKIYVQSGTLTLNGDIDADGANAGAARTIILGGPASGTVSGVISDFNSNGGSVLSLTKSDAGSWLLTGLNSFTGAITIQEGTLKVATLLDTASAQPLGLGTAAITLGTATTAGTLEYSGAADATLARAVTVGNTGGGVLRNTGGAVLTLSGAITRAAARPLTFTGGAFIVTGAVTGAAAANNIDGAAVTFSNTTNSFLGTTNVFNGGVLTNGASGVLTDASSVVLGEASSNTGGTYDLNGFNETIASLSSAGTGATVVTNRATAGTAVLSVSSGAFNGILQDGATAQLGLTKLGAGILTLGGANTYTGKTTISSGTLALTGSTSSIRASTWVQLDAGATLDVAAFSGGYIQNGGSSASAFSGAGTVSGSLILDGRVILSPGSSSDAQNLAAAGDGLGTLAFNNDLTLLGGASTLEPRVLLQLAGATGNTADPTVAANVLAFASTASANVDHLNVAGTLTLHAGSVIKVSLAGYTPVSGDVFNLLDWGTLSLDGFDTAVDLHLPQLGDPLLNWNTDQFSSAGLVYITTSVPEPSRAVLSLGGLALLVLRRRRPQA